jgi:hypothetical protein
MCRHNEDDYDCLDCCYEYGKEDALENLPNSPHIKILISAMHIMKDI